MGNFDAKLKNEILDDSIIRRRTIRSFRLDPPAEDMVRQIITAGLHAPCARAQVESFTERYFRRFFVMRAGSDSIATTSTRLNERVKELAHDLEEKGRSWARRLKWWQDEGQVMGATNAPYFIVIAE